MMLLTIDPSIKMQDAKYCILLNLGAVRNIFVRSSVLHTKVFFLTEEAYNLLEKSTAPEIRRSNLATVILHLKALGIDNVLRFSFLTVSL